MGRILGRDNINLQPSPALARIGGHRRNAGDGRRGETFTEPPPSPGRCSELLAATEHAAAPGPVQPPCDL